MQGTSLMVGQARKTATKLAMTLEQRLWETVDARRRNQQLSECKHVAGIDNNPEGLVDVYFNRYKFKLPLETMIESLALISRAVRVTVSSVGRQP
jgi:hypothetical protein